MKIRVRDVVPIIVYLHNAGYNDDKLDDNEYTFLMEPLRKLSENDELNDECRERLYAMDILFSENNGRQIAYPFRYDNNVTTWKKTELERLKYICPKCNKPMNTFLNDKYEATIDHVPPLSTRFNEGEYLLSEEARRKSYNDPTRMTILCRHCNSSKGGVAYEREKLLRMNV